MTTGGGDSDVEYGTSRSSHRDDLHNIDCLPCDSRCSDCTLIEKIDCIAAETCIVSGKVKDQTIGNCLLALHWPSQYRAFGVAVQGFLEYLITCVFNEGEFRDDDIKAFYCRKCGFMELYRVENKRQPYVNFQALFDFTDTQEYTCMTRHPISCASRKGLIPVRYFLRRVLCYEDVLDIMVQQ